MCCDELLAGQSVDGVALSDPAVHVDLEPRPAAARAARRFVLDRAGRTAPHDTLALLTSEVVTNGVLHARTALRVGIVSGADRILVTVADDGAGMPVVVPRDDSRASGRGMVLVAALASEWGVFRHDSGKTVWFTVPRKVAMADGVA